MSVSLCVLRIEIDEELPEMGDNSGESDLHKDQKKDRGARGSRSITVETYASVSMGPNSVSGILPTSSRQTPLEDSDSTAEAEETISFFCGNPLIEVTKGVLHLYKENSVLGARDLLAFAAACQQDIAHVRFLRDGSLDHYMALLTFRTVQAAREFHSAFDGVPYSSLEPNALCHVAWVSRVEWGRDGTPPPSHTELPTCPVCLERMDESVAGVLSVQCAHAFHADCLLRWGDASCPVCRCAQTPEPRQHSLCFECEKQKDQESHDSTEDETKENVSGVAEGLLDGVEAGALWICLICGHVGCGRYERGHAAEHFLASNHTYALQLGSNRVWDYAGDNFVHRLVQNKGDGKLVAAEGGFTTEDGLACGGEKLDSAQLEFTYILTKQLDRQRLFYEEKIARIESEHATECENLKSRAEEVETQATQLQEQIKSLNKENKSMEKKLHQLTSRLTTLQGELAEERSLAAALATSQAEWQARAKLREENFKKEVEELKEQLRDVMFFVEARDRLQQSDDASQAELASASVSVAPPAKPRRKRHEPSERRWLSPPMDIRSLRGYLVRCRLLVGIGYLLQRECATGILTHWTVNSGSTGFTWDGRSTTATDAPKWLQFIDACLHITAFIIYEGAWPRPEPLMATGGLMGGPGRPLVPPSRHNLICNSYVHHNAFVLTI
ncbi:BRCA1-associated protein [Eumeta japonica]|uniref:BRCA1-associated protein n=1 Tax=Eumeta variegata TaxID=151549 RepID=A0A4C1VYJ5_EUMVA|nr:BRCA1-associated protein [Eumeta japonica]